MTENTQNLHLTFYSRATAGEYGCIGGCLEIGTVVTQKCGYDLCTIGGNTASVTASRILIISLKLKNRDGTKKQGDRNPSRMVMIGLYPKGTDGQMYTSSSICKYILLKEKSNYFR